MNPIGLIRNLGRLLVAFGVLVLAFAAYQLWGTSLLESHSQSALRHQFNAEARRLRSANPGPALSLNSTLPQPALQLGSAVALIEIPKIDVSKAVVQGVSESNLQSGPGHYPGSPMPGQPGNAAIAGHRTTFGAPFYRLNDLRVGDSIIVTTLQGTFRYSVVRSLVVSPNDTAVVGPSKRNILTLTTCTPLYSAAQRLVVQAKLVSPLASTHRQNNKLSTRFEHSGRLAPRANANLPPNFSEVPWEVSLSTLGSVFRRSAWEATIFWGLVTCGFASAAAILGRTRRQNLTAAVVGIPLVLASLFIFFTALSPLLPAYL